jgi:hypothetical protein
MPGWQSNNAMSYEQLGTTVNPLLDAIQLDKRGLEAFRNDALRTGPSKWAGLAKKNIMLQERQARDLGRRESAGQAAQARSMLAMRGGLTSGARERVAKSAAKDYMNMSQQIGATGQTNLSQIDMNDEQNRINMLSQLPGMEVQALQPELQKTQLYGQAKQYDITNRYNQQKDDIKSYNDYAQKVYEEQMKGWAADRTASGMENSGKK